MRRSSTAVALAFAIASALLGCKDATQPTQPAVAPNPKPQAAPEHLQQPNKPPAQNTATHNATLKLSEAWRVEFTGEKEVQLLPVALSLGPDSVALALTTGTRTEVPGHPAVEPKLTDALVVRMGLNGVVRSVALFGGAGEQTAEGMVRSGEVDYLVMTSDQAFEVGGTRTAPAAASAPDKASFVGAVVAVSASDNDHRLVASFSGAQSMRAAPGPSGSLFVVVGTHGPDGPTPQVHRIEPDGSTAWSAASKGAEIEAIASTADGLLAVEQRADAIVVLQWSEDGNEPREISRLPPKQGAYSDGPVEFARMGGAMHLIIHDSRFNLVALERGTKTKLFEHDGTIHALGTYAGHDFAIVHEFTPGSRNGVSGIEHLGPGEPRWQSLPSPFQLWTGSRIGGTGLYAVGHCDKQQRVACVIRMARAEPPDGRGVLQ